MAETPILVAHRGYAAAWPENTLPALEAAVAAGARWVEVDVQLCADGVAVLLHDADLERVAGRAGSIFELTAAELAEVPVGEPARFGTRFSDARAPTLVQFSTWLADHAGVQAFVELKDESIQQFGRAAVLAACQDAMAPLHGRWVPIAADYQVLQLAAEGGAARLGWVVREFDAASADRARALPARWLFRNHRRLPDGPLAPGPWDWVCYEVGDVDTARDLLARGARWLETMDFVTLHAALLQGDQAV